jgi:hypothetical protein
LYESKYRAIGFEKVACGKQQCSVCHGKQLVHGPYAYLHFQDKSSGSGPPWPVKKKYLLSIFANLSTYPRHITRRLEFNYDFFSVGNILRFFGFGQQISPWSVSNMFEVLKECSLTTAFSRNF